MGGPMAGAWGAEPEAGTRLPQPPPPARARPEDGWFSGRRVVVMGLGRFGGGAGVTRWLAERGADVLLTDTAEAGALAGALAGLTGLIDDGSVALRLGGHHVSDFTTADAVVVNPAVGRPWENRFVRGAWAAGALVLTEIGLALDRMDMGRVIGVTGTAGKSTTAAMIHAGLSAALGGGVYLGGNIGGSMLGELGRAASAPAAVVELSSAMLWWLGPPRPGTAVVTNVAPNHIDWHGSLGHYAGCKALMIDGVNPGRVVLGPGAALGLGLNGPGLNGLGLNGPGAFEGPLAVIGGHAGGHNRANAGVALRAAQLAAPAADIGRIARGISGFGGLPHRLQSLGVRRGVLCVNDSKSTTPEAAGLAIEAVAQSGFGPIRLIAGGYDKGVELSGMLARRERLGRVYAIGQTAPALAAAAAGGGGGGGGGGGLVEVCGELERAVEAAARDARAGEAVLLSPGCASWDQFEHYEARGAMFEALIERWFGVAAGPGGGA